MPGTVAIVGRPNVGKSTLFNRLVGKRLALVDDSPGVTRDRREGEARLAELGFRIVDTAGLEETPPDQLEARMRAQSERAVAEADAILFLVDARQGVTAADAFVADLLRRAKAPVLLLANKCEGAAAESGRLEAYSLGLGDPVPFSAEHGQGLDEVYEFLKAHLPDGGVENAALAELAVDEDPVEELSADGEETPEEDKRPLQLVIIGRPNAGKSTLVNRLLGDERMLTGPEAGITRDSVAVDWSWEGRPIRLIDTAGLRRKARVDEKLEKLSVADALRALRYAHVACILIDGTQGLERQDLTIATHVVEEGRALLIGVNKWDLVQDKAGLLRDINDRLERSLSQARGIPVVTLSALQGRNLDRFMKTVFQAYDIWNRRVPTAALNQWLGEVVSAHPPPLVDGRRIRLKYMTQVKARPPAFAIFSSRPGAMLPDSYLRYLENALRQDFDLPGTPIRIFLRKGANPYAK